MPNKEHLRSWVAALRSGGYRQGRGYLARRDADGGELLCCLEVGNRVAAANGVVLPAARQCTVPGHPPGAVKAYQGAAHTGLMTAEAWNWFGFPPGSTTIGNPVVGVLGGGDVTATTANDSLTWSFERIADELVALYDLDSE